MSAKELLVTAVLSIGLGVCVILLMILMDRLARRTQEDELELRRMEYPRTGAQPMGRSAAWEITCWAISGWPVVVLLLLFLGVKSVFAGDTFALLDTLKGRINMLGWAASFAVAGLPVGYVLNQLYWWIHWANLPTSIVHRDKAFEVLKDASIDFEAAGIGPLDMSSKDTRIWRPRWLPFLGLRYLEKKPKDITERHQRNWYLADFVWYDTLRKNNMIFLEHKATHLSWVYHCQGSSRLSLVLAFIGYAVWDFVVSARLMSEGRWLEYVKLLIVPMVFNFVISCIIFFVLSHMREDTMENLIALKHDVITKYHKLPRKIMESKE